MARPLPVEYAGSWYYVTARGNERRRIFRDDKYREQFVSLLGEMEGRFGLEIHGYVLMDNHYHLLLRMGNHRGPERGDATAGVVLRGDQESRRS